jgi:Transcriptional regulator/sugar kinase
MLLGLDIGGTKCAVSCGMVEATSVNILQKNRFDTPLGLDKFELLDKLSYEIDKVINTEVKSIGVSCGGPLDSTKGIILSPPNLPGWDEIPIVDYLSKRFGVPVAIQNDANACAMAEHRFGAGRGTKNMIFLTFGTGLGAGLILNGEIYSGTNDMAGEIGHIRLTSHGPVGYGKMGSMEGFCSGGGIAQLGQALALERIQRGEPAVFCPDMRTLTGLNAKNIADAADAGDLVAAEVYYRCGKMLGRGLAVLIDILNPELIVIGSIFRRSENLLREAMQREIEREALPLSRSVCKIVPAGLGEEIGDYAALAVAEAVAARM